MSASETINGDQFTSSTQLTACSVGVSLVWATLLARDHFWLAMFDLELEWMVGEGQKDANQRRLFKY